MSRTNLKFQIEATAVLYHYGAVYPAYEGAFHVEHLIDFNPDIVTHNTFHPHLTSLSTNDMSNFNV
jgi:hypothetical protein